MLSRVRRSVQSLTTPAGTCDAAPAHLEPLEERCVLAAVAWTGAVNSSWDTPGNWSTGSVPVAVDDVTINVAANPTITLATNVGRAVQSLISAENLTLTSGSLSVAGNATLSSIVQSSGTAAYNGVTSIATGSVSGGTMTGTGAVSIAGAFAWSGGGMTGTGSTVFGPASTVTLTGVADIARPLTFAGTTNWTAGNLPFRTGGSVVNSGAFTVDSAGLLQGFGNSTGAFIFTNVGTFTKANTGQVRFILSSGGLAFNNSGAVTVGGGTLGLDRGGTHTGDFALAAGTTLRIAETQAFAAGADVTGSGTLQVSGGAATFDGFRFIPNVIQTGGTSTVNGAITIGGGELSAGTWAGPGAINVTGVFSWSGGGMSGAGETTFSASSTVAITGTWSVGRVATFGGTTTWTAGSLIISTGGGVVNTGTFTVDTAGLLQAFGDVAGAFQFTNSGTFVKLNSGQVRFIISSGGVEFNNTGTVTVGGGTLGLDRGGTHTGDFALAAGTTFRLGGGHTFAQGSDITGAGILTVDDGLFDFGGTANVQSFTITNAQTRMHVYEATTFSAITAAGNGVVGGTFTAIFDNGFDPSNPTIYLWDADVITAAAITGSFSSFIVPTTTQGVVKAFATPTSIVLLHDIFDFDGNESIDSDDISAFFLLWDQGDNLADINGDGAVDSNDIIDFFAGWDAGGR